MIHTCISQPEFLLFLRVLGYTWSPEIYLASYFRASSTSTVMWIFPNTFCKFTGLCVFFCGKIRWNIHSDPHPEASQKMSDLVREGAYSLCYFFPLIYLKYLWPRRLRRIQSYPCPIWVFRLPKVGSCIPHTCWDSHNPNSLYQTPATFLTVTSITGHPAFLTLASFALHWNRMWFQWRFGEFS